MHAICLVETPVSRVPPLGFFVHLLLRIKPLYEEIVRVSSFACFLSLTLVGLSFVFSFCSLFAVTPHSGGAVIPYPFLFKGWYFLQMGFLQCARLFRLCICCCDVYLYWCFSGLLVPVGSLLLPVTSAFANSEYFCALVFLFAAGFESAPCPVGLLFVAEAFACRLSVDSFSAKLRSSACVFYAILLLLKFFHPRIFLRASYWSLFFNETAFFD